MRELLVALWTGSSKTDLMPGRRRVLRMATNDWRRSVARRWNSFSTAVYEWIYP